MTAGTTVSGATSAATDAGRVTDRRAGRISGTAPLASDPGTVSTSRLSASGSGSSRAPATGQPCSVGDGLGDKVSSNDPKRDGARPPAIRPCTDDPADEKTAEACNEFIRQSHDILSRHPMNVRRMEEGLAPGNLLLIRGAGKMGAFPQFSSRYGLSGSVISAATLIAGIGKVVGLEHIPVPGTTGSVDSDLDAKVKAALAELTAKTSFS